MARNFGSMTEMEEFFGRTGAQGRKKAAANMSREERSESARKAVLVRWAKKKTAYPKVRSTKSKRKLARSKTKWP
jgi:hypothetical protein